MSIYSSWLDIDDNDHDISCASYERIGPADSWPDDATMATSGEDGATVYYRGVNRPCTCGNKPPIIYQGSHVNPSDDDPRGGSIDIAAIPNHCHPAVRGTATNDGPPVWFLRLTVDEDETTYHGMQPGRATVVLDRSQVEKIRDTLTRWLDEEERY